jgi:hypothetical protein
MTPRGGDGLSHMGFLARLKGDFLGESSTSK